MTTESCELCSTDEQFVRATVFCVDCSESLCDRCSLPPHETSRGTADDSKMTPSSVESLEDEMASCAISPPYRKEAAQDVRPLSDDLRAHRVIPLDDELSAKSVIAVVKDLQKLKIRGRPKFGFVFLICIDEIAYGLL